MSDNSTIETETDNKFFVLESFFLGFKGIDRNYQLIALHTLVQTKNEIDKRKSSDLPEDPKNWRLSTLENFKKSIGAGFLENGDAVATTFELMLGNNSYEDFSFVFNKFLEKSMLYFIDQGRKLAPETKIEEIVLERAA